MPDPLKYSRPLATANRLADVAEDANRFIDKRVLLTGESDVLGSQNGRDCFLSSLRLLVRFCADVSVFLPTVSAEFAKEVFREAGRIEPAVKFRQSEPDPREFDAILNVGSRMRPDLPWTVINSNGWLARVSSVSSDLAADTGQPNPIAALAAASLGAGEVFKRLIRLKETRGKFFDGLSFSFYTYSPEMVDLGPILPEEIDLDLLLVGAGAIGNGIIYLLDRLPVRGNITVVDSEKYGPENFGTCLLIGQSEIDKEKARFAFEMLGGKLDTKHFTEEFSVFSNRLGTEIPFPRIVLNAVDNIDTRHEIQRELWSDLIIDGAIGDFSCQVTCHPLNENVACLMCLFRKTDTEPAQQRASRATGLTPSRTQDPEATVTEEDVRAAPAKKKEWLRGKIGKLICSVVQEAVAQSISEEKLRKGFQPSVPFVACLSSSMMIGELVRSIMGHPPRLEPRFQFDVVRGPQFGQDFPQERRPDCICVTRRENIDTLRYSRAGNNASPSRTVS